MLKKLLKLLNKYCEQHPVASPIVLIIAVIVACYAVSWLITCGLIKLITLCFGWTFKWSVSTGIWLLICIAKSVFSHNVTVKK